MAGGISMAAWIHRQLTRHYEEGADETMRVIQFTLFHIKTSSQVGDEIHTLKLGSQQYDSKVLAKRFDEIACTTAEGMSGRQQFALRAIYEDSTLTSESFPFQKAGESFDQGLGTEGPTQQGHMSQMMRHNEALVRINTVHSESVISSLKDLVSSLGEGMRDLMSENANMFRAMKELRVQQLDEEFSRNRELLQFQRATSERQKLFALLPGFVNTVVGKKILPEGGLAEIAFQQLKQTITPDQVAGLAQILTPEQLAMVAPLLEQDSPPVQGQKENDNESNPNG